MQSFGCRQLYTIGSLRKLKDTSGKLFSSLLASRHKITSRIRRDMAPTRIAGTARSLRYRSLIHPV